MSKRVTQSYAPEFRTEAIKLVLEQGLLVVEAAARLSMNQGTLAYWVTQARKAGNTSPANAGAPSASDLMAEVRQLRKELAEARMERDILKNRLHGAPEAPMNRNTRTAYTEGTHGLWPFASWRVEPRQKTWPRGLCGPICGGAIGRPRLGN